MTELSFFWLQGEAWADAVNADLTHFAPAKRREWVALFKHALSATSARRLGQVAGFRWKTRADDRRRAACKAALLRWLPLVSSGQTIPRLSQLRGRHAGRGRRDERRERHLPARPSLAGSDVARPDELTRLITAVALSAYKKVPGVGPRAVKVGNAAVYALSEMESTDAVGQLAMLKVRVKFGTAQKEIEKAFTTAAEALGLPRDQIEEMGVPSYGLEEVGSRSEQLGDYRAELIVTGSDAELQWFDAKGKPLKSVPAKVKSDHKDELKELQQSLKDIQAMLPAQRDRIDSMFLLRKPGRWRNGASAISIIP